MASACSVQWCTLQPQTISVAHESPVLTVKYPDQRRIVEMSAQVVELLPRWLLNLYRLLLGICTITFSIGVVGTYIMMDVKRENPLSHSSFATMIYKMVQFNQMSVSALVNGSLVSAYLPNSIMIPCSRWCNIEKSYGSMLHGNIAVHVK